MGARCLISAYLHLLRFILRHPHLLIGSWNRGYNFYTSEEVNEDPEHLLIKEVVREPRIHFFTVPRLGSYLAIKLEYKSCLSVEAYNAGI